jgi:hypothetical protein
MLYMNYSILFRAACNIVSHFDFFYSLYCIHFSNEISLYLRPTFMLELEEKDCQCIFTSSLTYIFAGRVGCGGAARF